MEGKQLLALFQRLIRSNYRPVTLNSVIGVFNFENIMKFLIINEIITPGQHCRVPYKACMKNLLETLDIITDGVKNGGRWKSIDLLLLDFARAFIKVSHEKLLLKHEVYGIDIILVNLLKDFLSNRSQRVVIGENTSEWVEVTGSVQQ